MSIEQKIADLLAESKKLQQEEIVEEEIVSEEAVKPVKGEEIADNIRANDDQTINGVLDTGISATTDDDNDQSNERTPKGGTKSGKRADTTSGIKTDNPQPVDQSKEIKVNVSEDVAALVNGEDLSEEFKTKAATIFEAAVVTRVKEEVSKLEEQFELQLQEQVEDIKEGLIEKVDGYLNYVVEQWMEQNELALESGIKSEIVENFISGMKGLFEQHYIDIPEEKYDVLGDMEETISSLEEKLNEQVESAVALTQELNSIKRENVIAEAANGLADTDAEKFQALAEELTFEDAESFSTKLQTIRENYFGKKATSGVQSVVTDEPVQITEEKVYSPMISAVLQQLNSVK